MKESWKQHERGIKTWTKPENMEPGGIKDGGLLQGWLYPKKVKPLKVRLRIKYNTVFS